MNLRIEFALHAGNVVLQTSMLQRTPEFCIIVNMSRI